MRCAATIKMKIKVEEAAIQAHYPTATRAEIMEILQNKTWIQILRKAQKQLNKISI